MVSGSRRLWIVFLLVAVAFGLLYAWIYRHDIRDLDGISYLDMGDAFFRGDWGAAVNGYWSPLYAWLLGLALLALKPSTYWEYSVVQVVNFAAYLFALGCFSFLMRELILHHRQRSALAPGGGRVYLPEWAWPALGYPLFIWSSLYWVFSWLQCPDMWLAGFVYLASGTLVRIRRRAASRLTFAAFGVALGFGYLTKAVMLPLTCIFLLVSILSVASLRRELPRILISVAIFLLLAGPFIVALSWTKGRLTFGDTGTLNYTWYVNHVGLRHWPHWTGGPTGNGTPAHPERRILDDPAVYEFRTPVRGTYPVWYDPSYWYEGLQIGFNVRNQVRCLKTSLRFYFHFLLSTPQSALLLGFLAILTVGGSPRLQIISVLRYWFLFVPAIAAMTMYALVNVESRYVGAFVMPLWLAVYSGLSVPARPGFKKFMAGVIIALTASFMIATSVATARDLINGGDATAQDFDARQQWKVAEGLLRMGVQPGHEVAVIGNGQAASRWARLARLRIVAELPWQEEKKFWEADAQVKQRVIDALMSTGVNAIVADNALANRSMDGWRRIGDTNRSVYMRHRSF